MRDLFTNVGRAVRGSAAALVLAGSATTMIGAAEAREGFERTVVIVNETDSTITYLYASNVEELYWGPDYLGYDVVKSGEQMQVDFNDGTEHCYFDLQLRFLDGTITERRSVNVCVEETITFN